MLTCKVGETLINCYDGAYDKHKLKIWSSQNKLVCPDCGKRYEYCHGEINHPYFRHKEKSRLCDGLYYEPETDEHIKGKLILYNWLDEMRKIGIINNLKLESYIPSTKQKPDIYFEIGDEKYVLEFQCTPIASEFLKRRELYKLANINDIWVLGKDKYNIEFYTYTADRMARYKTIEKHCGIYLDTSKNRIAIDSEPIKDRLPYKEYFLKDYYIYQINEFVLDAETKEIRPNDKNIQYFIDIDTETHERNKKKI